MKKSIFKLLAATLIGAAILSVPALSRAQDTSTNAPSTAPAKAKHEKFNGPVSAVDTNAMTFTVGDQTFNVTSDSMLYKKGQPATLSDVVVGDAARGTYTTGSDGKLDVTKARFGKGGGKKKKQSTDSDSSTPPPPAGGSN